MTPPDSELFAAATRLRLQLADFVASLTDEQLATPSLCEQWTVRQVAGHLTVVLRLSNLSLLAAAARRGFDLHRANAELAKAEAALPLNVLLANLRDRAATPMKPPVVGALGPLTDLLVHGGDMRLPLGLAITAEPALLDLAMDFLVTAPPGFVPKKRLAGLGLVSTDSDRRWLAGEEIRGRTADLMMAVCGRGAVLDRLTGPGVDTLTARL